ncbi:MAG: hypothetical protein LW595_06295 [Rickettsiales bacterium]|nr:hypothetical protein [Rickettsiales bacterium]
MRINVNNISYKHIIEDIKNNCKVKLKKTLRESCLLIKDNLKKELKSKDKIGALKSLAYQRKYPASPIRRSAIGQSLARDTGKSERNISYDIENSSAKIGFLSFEDDYIAKWEFSKNEKRPTMLNAINKSSESIKKKFEINLKP